MFVHSFNVATDKVYENKEWEYGYRENEPLDSYDPSSNSKSCSELMTHSYCIFTVTQDFGISKKEFLVINIILKRNYVTLIFAVMHWLSELVRYNPEKFELLMGTKQNWLIHDFVDNAPYHYIDEISCEIT